MQSLHTGDAGQPGVARKQDWAQYNVAVSVLWHISVAQALAIHNPESDNIQCASFYEHGA